MEKLFIAATRSTPEIAFDPAANTLSITGQSYPENAFGFYKPLLEWVERFLAQLDTEATVEIDFSLAYINTSSIKCIMMLLEQFDKAFQNNRKITLNWYYDVDNENELECAEEFKEDLSLPFHIIPKRPEER